jgi:hypothetical protein
MIRMQVAADAVVRQMELIEWYDRQIFLKKITTKKSKSFYRRSTFATEPVIVTRENSPVSPALRGDGIIPVLTPLVTHWSTQRIGRS